MGIEASDSAPFTITYKIYRYHGGAPPYRGWHDGGEGTITLPGDSTLVTLADMLKHEVDPDDRYDLVCSAAQPHEVQDRNGTSGTTFPSWSISGTVRSVFQTQGLQLRVFVPFGRGMVDIGTFAMQAEMPGSQFLVQQPATASREQVQELVQQLHGGEHAMFQSLDKVKSLDQAKIDAVKRYCETKYQEQCERGIMEDFKLYVTHGELETLVGVETVRELVSLFGDRIDEIVIRRCTAHGKCVNFHVDYSQRTMQVALNGDHEYTGGRLIFATNGELCAPARPAGSVTIHGCDIVHGVSELQSGTRYGLLFLEKVLSD